MKLLYPNFINVISIPLAAILLLNLSACDPYGDDEVRKYLVVESYLIAGESMPVVRLSRTAPIDQEYSFEKFAINEADVTIHLLEEDGEESQTSISYSLFGPGGSSANEFSPGVYLPTRQHTIQPGRKYRLQVEVPDFPDLQSATIIPDTFSIQSDDVPESIMYQSSQQLELIIRTPRETDRQNVYIFNTESLNPVEGELVPFYKSAFDDGQIELRDLTNNPSSLINEANFEKTADGDIKLRYPWIGVAFFGPNRISVNSVDRNISDFIRSQEVQLGGSTLSPGEIPNAVYNIEGGIGVFGSVATDTVSTRIEKP